MEIVGSQGAVVVDPPADGVDHHRSELVTSSLVSTNFWGRGSGVSARPPEPASPAALT